MAVNRGMGRPSSPEGNFRSNQRRQMSPQSRMDNARSRGLQARDRIRSRRGGQGPVGSPGGPVGSPGGPVAGGMPDLGNNPKGGPTGGSRPTTMPVGSAVMPPNRTVRPARPRPMQSPSKAMSNNPPSMGGTVGQTAPSQPLGSPVGTGGSSELANVQMSNTPAGMGQGRPMMNRQMPYNANGRTINTTGPGLLQRDYRPF